MTAVSDPIRRHNLNGGLILIRRLKLINHHACLLIPSPNRVKESQRQFAEAYKNNWIATDSIMAGARGSK